MAGYIILSMPYMYRAIDVGMRSIDVRTLTEAAQSLGSNWLQIMIDVILPNMRIAILSGSLICFATVIGELIPGDFLVRPALGPYMVLVGRDKAYEPAALAILSYALTWFCLGIIQHVSRGGTSQQLTGRQTPRTRLLCRTLSYLTFRRILRLQPRSRISTWRVRLDVEGHAVSVDLFNERRLKIPVTGDTYDISFHPEACWTRSRLCASGG